LTKRMFSSTAMAGLLLVAACGAMVGAEKERQSATAEIKDGKDQVVGQAKFKAAGAGVEMSVKLTNLSPGVHAIHLHAVGKCDAPDFKTAGGHFNPANKKHGTENPEGHHAGDLPNLTVGPNGESVFSSSIPEVTLAGTGPNSLFHEGGPSVVVHEQPDDMKTDPAGNAGARIACGVIQ